MFMRLSMDASPRWRIDALVGRHLATIGVRDSSKVFRCVAVNTNLKRAERLRQSVLARAFVGPALSNLPAGQ